MIKHSRQCYDDGLPRPPTALGCKSADLPAPFSTTVNAHPLQGTE